MAPAVESAVAPSAGLGGTASDGLEGSLGAGPEVIARGSSAAAKPDEAGAGGVIGADRPGDGADPTAAGVTNGRFAASSAEAAAPRASGSAGSAGRSASAATGADVEADVGAGVNVDSAVGVV
jgi:hypothetical protein